MQLMREGIRLGGFFIFECYDQAGRLKWMDRTHNMVVNAGLEHILDVVFTGTTAVSTWYVGLASSSMTVASGDTMASHAGWTEFTSYADDRKEWVEARTNRTITNSASAATFTINTAGTVGGGFLCDVATGNSVLMCAAALSGGDRAVVDTDTINLTYQLTAADS